MADTMGTDGLQVRRTRLWLAPWVLVVVALVAVGAWFATHPEPLPTSDDTLTASTPLGVPVYVGVFTPTAGSGRSLEISDVAVHTAGDAEVTVAPMVCRDGALSVTTAPNPFCSALVPASGARLGPADELVLQVTGETPGTADIDRVEVSYRDGLQWATQEAGRPALVTILDR